MEKCIEEMRNRLFRKMEVPKELIGDVPWRSASWIRRKWG